MGQQEKQIKAYILVTLVCLSSVLPALTAPPPNSSSHHGQGRKFAVKHNNPKKVHYSKTASPSAEPQSEKAGVCSIKLVANEHCMASLLSYFQLLDFIVSFIEEKMHYDFIMALEISC